MLRPHAGIMAIIWLLLFCMGIYNKSAESNKYSGEFNGKGN
jgi:hypothetical protein